jgi:hypothetical protein
LDIEKAKRRKNAFGFSWYVNTIVPLVAYILVGSTGKASRYALTLFSSLLFSPSAIHV